MPNNPRTFVRREFLGSECKDMDMLGKSFLRWLAPLLLVFPLAGCGPQNYDDCILENLRGVSNDRVAVQVRLACRSKFPNRDAAASNNCATRQMTSIELSKIQVSATVNYDELRFFVYNGNLTDIQKMFVRIAAPNFTAPQDYEVQPPLLGKEYPLVRANTGARELRVSVATLPLDGWQYQVIGAETCKS